MNMRLELERWLRGEEPRFAFPEHRSEEFFQELHNRGFVEKGEPLQVHGFSGPYILTTYEDASGNQVAVQYGGRMPTKVDFYKAGQTPSQQEAGLSSNPTTLIAPRRLES